MLTQHASDVLVAKPATLCDALSAEGSYMAFFKHTLKNPQKSAVFRQFPSAAGP